MKKSISSLVAIFIFVAAADIAYSQAKKFRKVDKSGEANIIFSSQQIQLNKESSVKLKTSFNYGEPIYSRVYFPGPIGKLREDEKLFADIWIDDKHAGRLTYKTVDPTWDTIQIFINNTGDDEFDASYFSGLSSGSHKVSIYVAKENFMKSKKVAEIKEDSIEIKNKKVFTAKYLSKGTFTLVVK
jgi:hypothetical protein